jgi:hypothetical protein
MDAGPSPQAWQKRKRRAQNISLNLLIVLFSRFGLVN